MQSALVCTACHMGRYISLIIRWKRSFVDSRSIECALGIRMEMLTLVYLHLLNRPNESLKLPYSSALSTLRGARAVSSGEWWRLHRKHICLWGFQGAIPIYRISTSFVVRYRTLIFIYIMWKEFGMSRNEQALYYFKNEGDIISGWRVSLRCFLSPLSKW